MEVSNMNWETPAFVEIKMDSEINSYQDDFADLPDGQERIEHTVKAPMTVSNERS
jgi:hypothetical protein